MRGDIYKKTTVLLITVALISFFWLLIFRSDLSIPLWLVISGSIFLLVIPATLIFLLTKHMRWALMATSIYALFYFLIHIYLLLHPDWFADFFDLGYSILIIETFVSLALIYASLDEFRRKY